MMVQKVDPKGRIVIPKDLRKRFGLTPGTKVQIRTCEDGVIVEMA